MILVKPGLFGLKNSNKDFGNKQAWGKNEFNSTFPASLCCYLASKKISANYVSILNGKISVQLIDIDKVFKIEVNNKNTYFAFESQFTPFQKYIIGILPRTDLVIQRSDTGECLTGLEVKLTVIPDNSTCELHESNYGCEIVVRPDTIVYLGCSIAESLGEQLDTELPEITINDWTKPRQVLKKINSIISVIEHLSVIIENNQTPFLLQPIWKTNGKSPQLADNCLDVFVWSNSGFCNFISKIANRNPDATNITRQTRTAIWLYKMLLEIKLNKKFNHKLVIDSLSYNTKNDKAFSSAGHVTYKYMKCKRLMNPIINKNEIKNIILGGGQKLLSPERRFDAIIYNSSNLF